MKSVISSEGNNFKSDIHVTSSILDAFDLLKAQKDDIKLNGGAQILGQLNRNEEEKDQKYVLKRLVRSLGANVPEMRSGYFATLVAFLKKVDSVTIAQLLELVKKELHASGSSKSEVGDVALGQILLCGAIFRSGKILKCTNEEQKQIIDLIIKASTKKSYLNTIAYLMLLDFVNTLTPEQFSSIIWSNIKQELKKDFKEHNLDTLYFLMMVSQKFPEKVKLQKLMGVSEILCEDNIHSISEKLMTGVDFSSLNHPIYSEVAKQISNSPHLQIFWSSGIDPHLVKHNRNRELAAINMLTTILSNIKTNLEVIPDLISKNFFKLFMDWFKGLQTASKIRTKRNNEDDQKLMIKKEKDLLNSLAKALKSENVSNKIRVKTLQKLLFNPGEMNFTEITGTSIIKSITADLDEDGVKKMAKKLKGVLLNTTKKYVKEDVERNWYNNERLKAAELISYLVIHEKVKDDTEFKLTYMKFLMCFGFFKIGGENNAAVSSELSNSIKTCFYRCFSSRFSNIDSLVEVLSALSDFINNFLEKEEIRTKLEKQFTKKNMECWTLVTEVCKVIEHNESKSKVDNVFLILLYQLGLFLFSEPTHVKMAVSSIKELKSCYEHYRKGKKNKQKIGVEGIFDSEEPEWIEVLVEVMLSILSTESSVLRAIIQCVFRLLWEYITPSALGQIVSVLDPESESNPLSQDSDSDKGSDDESNHESDSEDEDGDDDSDKDSPNDDDEDNEVPNTSDTEIEPDDDDEVKVPEQLRMAVQKALGVMADSDADSINADDIDEEEGKRLDAALAEAFKQFQQGKNKNTKKERKDKKMLSDFRIRVLDLIDIYLEKDPSMDICLGMIAPLTRCLEFCIQDSQFIELGNRVRKTIKTLTKVKKFSTTEDVTVETLCDYLKSVIEKGARSHFLYQALGDVITNLATFIIYCSLKLQSNATKSPKKIKKISPLLAIFQESLNSYFVNRSCLLPIIFFHNVLQMDWLGSYELVPIITQNIFNNDVRQFRRNEGLELLIGFYKSLKRIKTLDNNFKSKLSDFEVNFEKVVFDNLKGNEYVAKNNFLVNLKKLVNIMKMFHESCHVDTNLKFDELSSVIGSCKGVKISNNHNNVNGNTEKSKKKKKNKKRKQLNGDFGPVKKKLKPDNSD